jgi:hypothetical protein
MDFTIVEVKRFRYFLPPVSPISVLLLDAAGDIRHRLTAKFTLIIKSV